MDGQKIESVYTKPDMKLEIDISKIRIGVICYHPMEARAMIALFDTPGNFATSLSCVYYTGKIGDHVIVISHPKEDSKEMTPTIFIQQFKQTWPNIKHLFSSGYGSGVVNTHASNYKDDLFAGVQFGEVCICFVRCILANEQRRETKEISMSFNKYLVDMGKRITPESLNEVINDSVKIFQRDGPLNTANILVEVGSFTTFSPEDYQKVFASFIAGKNGVCYDTTSYHFMKEHECIIVRGIAGIDPTEKNIEKQNIACERSASVVKVLINKIQKDV